MPDDESSARFHAQVAVHLDAVYRYFVRRAPRPDADDLTAEVFETAWRRRDSVPEGAELPWLYRTAGFVLANHRRRVRALPVHEVPEQASTDHAEHIADRDALERTMQRLSARDRDVLMLHAWEGLDGTELGEALGVSRSGAQAALSRARARFRDAWSAERGGPSAQESTAS